MAGRWSKLRSPHDQGISGGGRAARAAQAGTSGRRRTRSEDLWERATTCSDAIAGIEASNPQLLILDIRLPDGTGFEILQAIDTLIDDTSHGAISR